MNTTDNTVIDGYITIAQALKRLVDKAPARQSFYAAVKNGKIEKLTDGSGTILVRWESVLRYIKDGGFKRRGKRHKEKTAAEEGTTALSTPSIPSSIESNTADESNDTVAAAPAAQPTAVVRANPGSNSRNLRHPKNSRDAKTRPSAKGAPAPNRPAEHSAEQHRRRSILRKLKNMSRQLDFHESKEMRDWYDNRLLHLLRPEKEPVAV
jgi:hypothetical protein